MQYLSLCLLYILHDSAYMRMYYAHTTHGMLFPCTPSLLYEGAAYCLAVTDYLALGNHSGLGQRCLVLLLLFLEKVPNLEVCQLVCSHLPMITWVATA